jgi:hypothetical protein
MEPVLHSNQQEGASRSLTPDALGTLLVVDIANPA